MAAATATEVKKKDPGENKDRFWYPRFWDGMGVSVWFPLMAKNRFAIYPRRIGMFLIISLISFVNSFLALLQLAIYGRRINRTEIKEPPIFIVGHWRSGTTMLHELFVLDKRFTYPNTYECYAPSHALVSFRVFGPLLGILMPKRRPMDNMATGWNHPQEDEFALCNLGVPSPYLTLAFPNRPPQCQEYLDLQGVGPEARARWKDKFLWFVRTLTLRSPKRVVLKSPPHTARIALLREIFPDARFVHIVRDPYVIFASTVNLWKRLYKDEGLQVPRFEGLDEHVYETFNRMYAAFNSQQPSIPPGHFSEVRYEDLVADPIGQMRKVYADLGLDGFSDVLPALETYVASQKDYKTNRWQHKPEIKREINRRWSAYFEKYGYVKDEG